MNFSDTVGGGTSGLITLMPYSVSMPIEIGGDPANKGSATTLGLSQTDLNNVNGSGGLTIGDAVNTSMITVTGGLAI